MKMFKKSVSMLLSIIMILSIFTILPMTANAGVAPPYADLKNTTTVVTFDGKEWYLIDYDSSTVTLLAKECVAASQYNSSGSYVEYASSTVKTAVDNWYNNNITSNAKTAVFDNKMFLLTKDQANAMTTDTRKCSQASEANYNYWWLCSPGSFGNFASCVYGGNGNVLAYGYSVVYALGVRPALKLDLSKVEFDSATNTFAVASSHEHDFTYSVNGDTITATCTATGCDLTDDNEVTLTIVAPTLTIVGQTGDGISEYATLTGLEAFNEATGLNVAETDIKYYAVETYEIDGNTYKRQGNELDGAPTDAGEYIAGLTLSDVKISETATRDVTARTWYTITEPAPTYTVTWMNGDDILETDTDLEPGALPSYDGETPTKDEDDDFTYDFIGWTSGPNFYTPDELPIVDGDTTYVATFRLTAKPQPHTHSFTYSADGNVITATCIGTTGTCDLTNKQVTLTLNAPEHATYDDGKNANATITGEIPGVTTPTINYRRSDTPLSSAPTDAGTYTAWCQLGNATARVEYTVAKAVNPGYTTLPHAVENLVYTGEEQELITAGVTSTGQIAYTAGTDPENEPDVTTGGMPYSYSVPKMTNAGTYYVWCKLDGGKNYTSLGAQKIEVTIAKANPAYTVPTGLTATYGDTLSDVILPEGWSWSDDKQSVGGVETKTFKATFTPEDTTNYNTVSDIDVTVTVEKADITPTVSIDDWTYGEDANTPSVEGNAGEGEVTYTYKVKGADDIAYTETVPTDAGEYTVKATIAATDNYNSGEATADFTIAKATPVVKLDTKTLYYNGKWQELVLSATLTIGDDIDITDEAKLWYSLEGGLNELDYSPVGKNIGEYEVYTRVEALTDNINAIAYGEEPTAIVKIVAVPTVKMTDYTYGDKDNFPTPEVEGNVGDGEVTYKYYPADGDAKDAKVWDDSITELTIDAGDYKMFAEIAESETAVAVTTEAVDFTVGVKTVAEPTIIYTPEENTYSGDEITPAVTVKDGDVVIDASEYTVTYKENINAGTATITVTDNEGGNYTVSGEITFVIKKAELELTLTIEGWTFGEEANAPELTGNAGEGEVTYLYKLTDADDETYTETVPSNAGSYTVKAVIAETDNYLAGEKTADFTIAKAAINPEVTIEDWTYGEEANEPVVTGNTGEGNVVYTYATSDDYIAFLQSEKTADEVFTFSEAPTQAGTYVLRAEIAETDNYLGGFAYATFKIAKADIEPAVTIEGWTYGDDANEPEVTGNDGEGEVTYTYAVKDSDEFTSEVPDNAGDYTVKAVIAESTNYNGGECTADFTIAKSDITPTVTIEGWTYGEDANEPVVTGNDGNGEVTITYAVKGSDEFTADVPENAGEYTVKAVIAETDNYNGAEATADFTIAKADITPVVTIEGWTYGDDANEPEVTGNTGAGAVTITYAAKGSDEFTADVPENAGDYTVKAVIAETDNYNGAEATADFTIAKADITPAVTIEGWAYGDDAKAPEVTGNTGEGEVTFTYAAKDSDEFTADVPKNAGDYTVKAVIAETDNYNGGECTADFTIAKADPKMAEDGDFNVVAQELIYNGLRQDLITEYVKEGSGLVVRYSFYPDGMNPQIAGNIPKEKPVGEYDIYYMVEGNDNYNDIPWITEPIVATIVEATFDVTIEGWAYGEEANEPVATANFTDYEEFTYTYAVKGSDEFTADVPENVGEYTVKASITSENEYYSSLTATADFSIVKADITPAVTIEGWTYGDDANEPEITGNTGEGEVTITYAVKDSDEFTEEVPTDAGEYTVKAVIAETDSYNGAEATVDFTIAKAAVTPEVSIEGWTYGEEANEPEVTGNSPEEGEVTITYAVKGSDEFTEEVPTDAGEYTVKAVIAATDNYNSAEATADFTIAKADITPAVTIEGWTYGEYDETVNGPSVSGNPENGDVTYQYKVKGAADDTYTDERPEDTGDYTVKAVVSETANYNGAEAVADFTIAKAAVEPEIILDDWSYSEEPNSPAINEGGNPGNGAVEYTYAFKGSDAYSEIKPVLPGNYTVKAVIAETDNYLGTTVYKDFVIRKGTFEPTVTLESWAYGAEPNEPELTGNVSEGAVKFTYAPEGSDAFSATVPTMPGSYVVKASIASTDLYDAVEVTGTFKIEKSDFTITWKNDDGTVIDTTTVAYGDVPTHADATKDATEQYTYTFTGWTPEVVAATEDAEYIATFESTVNEYTITWKNDDGTVIDTTTVAYGDVPTHDDASKDATAQYTYTFLGWNPAVTSVTGDAEYTATYSSAVNEYTVTWVNGEDVLLTDTVAYGETPEYTGETPTKASTAEYDYSFAGWTPEVDAVTGDVTYTATFDSTQRSYTITWKNDDGSVIDTTTVSYGEVPTHADATKDATEQYTYTFAGWTPEIVAVTGDAEYTANFEAVAKTLLGDADGDGEVTIFDVTFIQRFLAHMPGVVINEAAADVDGDGEVSIIDVTLIQRHLASMPVKYPIDQYV